jgi:hypothetical protein
MLKNYVQTGTVTKGKKGAVSVPFHNARVPFCTIFAGFPLSVQFQLNTGGEIIGVTKAAALMVTEYGMWAARARDAVLRSKTLSLEEQMNLCDKLANALAKNDIRTILIIYKKYK